MPIGAFLIEHFVSNSESMNGVQAYNEQVKFLTSLPFVHVLEWVFIFIPLLYHGLYGLWIWYRGDSNVKEYPWSGNWLYTAQRWTGIVALHLHRLSRNRHALHRRAPDGRWLPKCFL